MVSKGLGSLVFVFKGYMILHVFFVFVWFARPSLVDSLVPMLSW